ncbi:MAG TPA: biopolymer transporter ExbD [Pirellulales bacterium]|jgi:biopolymer transport protein ExbD|nr:biopolymer transporter ExbD [Pirellulales bacterium]
MKIRKSAAAGSDKVEMQMTSMIDVVFQLLTFFVMSFKIATQEGDFNIKMPLAAASASASVDPMPPIKVRLLADAQGALAGIQMGERGLGSFSALNTEIMRLVGPGGGPGPSEEESPYEVEIDADYNLRYENVIAAITAVSGYVDQEGHVVKLIEKLKFAPPKKPS